MTSVDHHPFTCQNEDLKGRYIRWRGVASDEAAGIPRGIEPSREPAGRDWSLRLHTGALPSQNWKKLALSRTVDAI